MKPDKQIILQALRSSISKHASPGCDVFTSDERILFLLPSGDTVEFDPRKIADDLAEALTLAASYQGGN